MTTLHALFEASVREHGARTALVEGDSGARIDYAGLGRLSDRLRDRLIAMGVRPGDRVGIYLKKSVDSVASILGVLKTGAAYVPVDPGAPASRNAYIHNNCAVTVSIVDRRFEPAYRAEILQIGSVPPLLVVDGAPAGAGLTAALDARDAESTAPEMASPTTTAESLAYILYTSGSTGRPKGVMLSHRNAVSFVDWCSETFGPSADDIFSSHAPFHFDLSILDLYVPLKHGASLVLIPEDVGKEPLALSRVISTHRISVWYSAPSILSLLAQFGRIADHDFSSLRIVLFAGEVFPIVHLRSFARQVPGPRYFNLYGPTETNVCTAYEIPRHIPDDRVDPYPIGETCSNLTSRVVDPDGVDVEPGDEGELCIAGPNVMIGYWDLPDLTAGGFLPPDGTGLRWYKTGDIVVEETDGNFRYVGRRDRMVKKRGYRVELGEIESCLYRHGAVREAAVVAVADSCGAIMIRAHLAVREQKPSIIELKTFCSKSLPIYMIPDVFAFHDALPKTSTDKVDYVSLKTMS